MQSLGGWRTGEG